MPKEYSLSVIVPVFNEIQLVRPSVISIDSFLKQHVGDYEILIVESGSTDGSAAACDEIGKELSRVKVIHEGERKGFGSALKVGYKNASKDLVWLITVDLPFPLDALLEALPLFAASDCVLSFRASDGRGGYRKLMSLVYNGTIKALLGLKVRHVNSAFRIFKRETIQSLPLISNGWFLDAEVLYWLRKRDVRITEIPVPLVNRTAGDSKISSLTPLSMIIEALKFILFK